MNRKVLGPAGVCRRQIVQGLAAIAGAGLLVPRGAAALGDSTLVDIAELDLGPGTISRPEAWKKLLYRLTQDTSVEARSGSVRVKPTDAGLFEHPFVVLLGDGAFEEVSEAGVQQLSEFLSYGGFLVIDDTTGEDSSGFDASVRRLVSRLFPTRPLAPLRPSHSIFRAFFLLTRVPGRIDRYDVLEGVTVGNLCPLVYCRNDLSGALDNREGRDVYPVVPGGEAQRREAGKVMINLLMYALTANYKNDQAHIKQLMLERRLP